MKKKDEINILELYFNEISKIPLLTRDEEKQLAQKILNKDPIAKEKFIKSNLKLVVSIAKNYKDRGVSFLDLIEEGNLALIKAVETFDITRENKFSSYASVLIGREISRVIKENSKNIKIPIDRANSILKCKQMIVTLRNKLNRMPTLAEVALALNISVKKLSELLITGDKEISIYSIEKEELEQNITRASSESTITRNPDEQVIEEEKQKLVRELLLSCNLDEREIYILIHRYGFKDKEITTQKEIGEALKISGNRVGQIERGALNKIRKAKRTEEYSIFMDKPELALKKLKHM